MPYAGLDLMVNSIVRERASQHYAAHGKVRNDSISRIVSHRGLDREIGGRNSVIHSHTWLAGRSFLCVDVKSNDLDEAPAYWCECDTAAGHYGMLCS